MTADRHDATRLRGALASVADRHQPDADAWAQIQARVEAGDAGDPLELAPSSTGSRRRAVLLAAAAAVALVLGTVAVITRPATDDADVATTGAPEPATGWYVPVGLPDGWRVTNVEAQRWTDPCPCSTIVWTNDDRSQFVVSQEQGTGNTDEFAEGADVDEETTIEVAPGVEATLSPSEAPEYWDVIWTHGDRYHSIYALGIPVAEAEGIASAVQAEPGSTTSPFGGLELDESWREPSTVGHDGAVLVWLETPDGSEIQYSLNAPHDAIAFAPSFLPVDDLAGHQPLPILKQDIVTVPDRPDPTAYLGRWPGATVRSTRFTIEEADGTQAPTDDQIAELMASLRPATTAEWAEFVTAADEHDAAALEAATLVGFING